MQKSVFMKRELTEVQAQLGMSLFAFSCSGPAGRGAAGAHSAGLAELGDPPGLEPERGSGSSESA